MPTQLKVPKDPNDIDHLLWDWSRRARTGETIVGFTATVVAGDVTVGATAIETLVTSASISGGTVGQAQSVRGRATFSSGRQLDWTIDFTIGEQ